MHDWDPSDITCTAWSLAKLGMCHQPFMDSIASSALRRCSEFAPQHLTGIAWSCATLCIDDKPLIKALAKDVIKKISEFDPLNLANMAWSFARWLFSAFPDVPQGAYSVLWGTLQSNGIMNKDTFSAISEASLARIG